MLMLCRASPADSTDNSEGKGRLTPLSQSGLSPERDMVQSHFWQPDRKCDEAATGESPTTCFARPGPIARQLITQVKFLANWQPHLSILLGSSGDDPCPNPSLFTLSLSFSYPSGALLEEGRDHCWSLSLVTSQRFTDYYWIFLQSG
jgi:hypothetical protein